MSKKKQIKKSILTWLDEQANNGNELCIKWEGGGDSGWAYFEIDGETVENEYTEALVAYMYDHLDYGSWAGEFNASGTATYNPETKCFEGTDYYGEDSHDTIDAEIKISIPKDFWFDTFHLEVECYHEESCNVVASFNVKNGFLTDKHSDFCSKLQEELKEYFNDLFSNHELKFILNTINDKKYPDKKYAHKYNDNYEFRGCSDSWVLNRSEATEENDMLVFNITSVQIETMETEEKSVVLEITEEMVEDINDSLNA